MKYFIIYIILMFISTCINGFSTLSIKGEILRREGIVLYTAYFLLFYFCASLIESSKIKGIVCYTYIIVSLFIGILMLIHIYIYPIQQFYRIQQYYYNIEEILPYEINSIFYSSNHYGYYITITILISGVLLILEKTKKLKLLCLLNFIVNTVVLIVNNTLGCFIAVLFGLIFITIVISICNKKFVMASFIPLLLFLGIVFVMSFFHNTIISSIFRLFFDIEVILNEEDNNDAGSYRWGLWKATVRYIFEKPIFGHGTEGIYKRLYVEALYERTHNEFLQYTVFYGIPAGIMYIAGNMSVFIKGLKYRYKLDKYTICGLAGAFGYLVSSFFGMSTYHTAPFLFIFLGLGLAGKKHK